MYPRQGEQKGYPTSRGSFRGRGRGFRPHPPYQGPGSYQGPSYQGRGQRPSYQDVSVFPPLPRSQRPDDGRGMQRQQVDHPPPAPYQPKYQQQKQGEQVVAPQGGQQAPQVHAEAQQVGEQSRPIQPLGAVDVPPTYRDVAWKGLDVEEKKRESEGATVDRTVARPAIERQNEERRWKRSFNGKDDFWGSRGISPEERLRGNNIFFMPRADMDYYVLESLMDRLWGPRSADYAAPLPKRESQPRRKRQITVVPPLKNKNGTPTREEAQEPPSTGATKMEEGGQDLPVPVKEASAKNETFATPKEEENPFREAFEHQKRKRPNLYLEIPKPSTNSKAEEDSEDGKESSPPKTPTVGG